MSPFQGDIGWGAAAVPDSRAVRCRRAALVPCVVVGAATFARFALSLAFNSFADALQDALAPKSR
jgi:hypothetical protein